MKTNNNIHWVINTQGWVKSIQVGNNYPVFGYVSQNTTQNCRIFYNFPQNSPELLGVPKKQECSTVLGGKKQRNWVVFYIASVCELFQAVMKRWVSNPLRRETFDFGLFLRGTIGLVGHIRAAENSRMTAGSLGFRRCAGGA